MLFSAGQDERLKNYGARTSSSMIFKHVLLEGSTFLFQYSYTSRTPLETSQLGELKYVISPGYNVTLKNKSFRKGKIDIVYMVTGL